VKLWASWAIKPGRSRWILRTSSPRNPRTKNSPSALSSISGSGSAITRRTGPRARTATPRFAWSCSSTNLENLSRLLPRNLRGHLRNLNRGKPTPSLPHRHPLAPAPSSPFSFFWHCWLPGSGGSSSDEPRSSPKKNRKLPRGPPEKNSWNGPAPADPQSLTPVTATMVYVVLTYFYRE